MKRKALIMELSDSTKMVSVQLSMKPYFGFFVGMTGVIIAVPNSLGKYVVFADESGELVARFTIGVHRITVKRIDGKIAIIKPKNAPKLCVEHIREF